MKKNIKLVFIVSIILSLCTGVVLGVGGIEHIQAALNHDMKIFVNGARLTLTDEQGQNFDPIVYNGRTYVPARFIANALGANIHWNGDTQTIDIVSNDANNDQDVIKENPVVTIEMENGDIIKVELYPNIAPNTVNNFISLINKGFYNGLIFHRVIPGFMIQGGDPAGTGTGGPGYRIKGEFTENGFKNDLKHTRGVISMARSQNPDSAGSQFFIMVKDSQHLDGQYAAFGKVVEGMEAVDKIVTQERNSADKPLNDQRMKSVTVELFGKSYAVPEVIK